MAAMKSLVLIVAIIAELNVECHGQPGADSYHEDQDRGSPDEHQLLEDASASMKDIQGSFLEEERMQNNSESQRSNICEDHERPRCTAKGGYCIKTGTLCPGKLFPRLCRGTNCQCCVINRLTDLQSACPEYYGFFLQPASKQCFILYQESTFLRRDANALCQSDGLKLPHPFQAKNLRSYIVQRYGNVGPIWMDACANGTAMNWQDKEVVITPANPLWAPPKLVGIDYCLEMHASEAALAAEPDAPYYSKFYLDYHPYTLCELVM